MAEIAAHQREPRPRRAGARLALLVASTLLAQFAFFLNPSPAFAQAITGEVSLTKPGNYARLLIKLAQTDEADVKVSGSILIVRFRRPIDVSLDKIELAAPDYITSVRRDPDGSALRFGLSRNVTVNTMAAGERLFVDLLPDGWTGQPPSLPREVVKELAERARIAEQKLRDQQMEVAARSQPPMKVHASPQPTFLRFVFDLPDTLNVSTDLGKDRFSLMFKSALQFDLADAKSALTPNVSAIDQRIEGGKSIVEISLIGDVDVHSFREDNKYIVDVDFDKTSSPRAAILQDASSKTPAPKVTESKQDQLPEVKKTAVESANAAPPRVATPAAIPSIPSIASKPEVPVADLPEMSFAPAMPVTIPTLPKPDSSGVPRPAASVSPPPIKVETERTSDALRLTFPFVRSTPAALFQRGQALWLVFDDETDFDLDAVRRDGDKIIQNAKTFQIQGGIALRLDLIRPKLVNLSADDSRWILNFTDVGDTPSQFLSAVRTIPEPSRASITIPFIEPGHLHRFVDPDANDTLIVITGGAPVRGFIKQQSFLEFSILNSIHGVLLQPKSDDLSVEVASDKIIIGRPGGLTLSETEAKSRQFAQAARKPVIELAQWRLDRAADFLPRLDRLTTNAAIAPPERRSAARLDLARFYMARGFYPEAKGVLDVVLADEKPGTEEPVPLVMRAVAEILIGRPQSGLTDLSNPAVGPGYDSALWHALALAKQGNWSEAREGFKNVGQTIATLPLELQQIALAAAARASLEVKDFAGATSNLDDLTNIGISDDLMGTVWVLRGRLAEATGNDGDASSNYHEAMIGRDRGAVADATWRLLALRLRRGDIKPDDALPDLETLSLMWRGDATEIATLDMLSRLYADRERYRDSFLASRTATMLQPNASAVRDMQDRASELFSQIFLTPKGEGLPPVDALAMFYEFRELTPIGRRGDEMIRRLADRLVAVDLLDQAAELLQYQIDKRLEGAARATVATRLATVYLMNRKPERAIAALQSARMADLAGEIRQQRLLLEARAQSDIGRYDLAYDLITNIAGREAVRLRSDIRWAARRWDEASEQIELLYGERWRDFQPLDGNEKSDIMRAAIGYALADDQIGMSRLREKYGPKFEEKADKSSFDLVTHLDTANSAQLTQIAKMAARVDTLDGFLREMKQRFPDALVRGPLPPETARDPASTGALPKIPGLRSAAVN